MTKFTSLILLLGILSVYAFTETSSEVEYPKIFFP